ncbi:PRC-barrel domain-containing protein [Blastopirellula marina]|uniref:PRC-barrel domain-containing protein n=1 Tax=Blastopirellula marina TaxID=124 RepID=A0A2S8GPL8_9BACT|nr:PRC-barrel domain-containing protein [Blastopirellula marina]PQO46362.1 hypothetical protein C5Y93_10295 [Blastopirellula marina]
MLVTRFLGLFLTAALVVPAIADDNTATKSNDGGVSTEVRKENQKKMDGRLAASQVIGASIYGVNKDETIGSVNDIVMNKDGEVVYVIVGSGGLAGVGETDHAVPAKAVQVNWISDGDNDADKELKISLPMTAEDLKNAPALSLEHASDLTVASFADRNSKYFKQTDGKQMNADNMYLVSEIDGLSATGTDNESLGTVADIVFTHNDACKAEYYIIGTGGVAGIGAKYTAVPVNKVTVTKTADNQYTAAVQANETILGAAPKVTSDHYYSELGDKNVRENVETAFSESEAK